MATTFPARNPGNPPQPFRPFPAGAIVFYLVALLDALLGRPTPAGQLQVESISTCDACDETYEDNRGRTWTCRKVPGHSGTCGYDPRTVTDTVRETAYRPGTRGRRRTVVATRVYSYQRTAGAKAAAAAAATWVGTDGRPLAIWCHLVTATEARTLGFQVPRHSLSADRVRPGRRGEGRENAAPATIRAGRAIPAAPAVAPAVFNPTPAAPAVAPTPAAPAILPEDRAAVPAGLAQVAAEANAAAAAAPARQVNPYRARTLGAEAAAAVAARAAARRQAEADGRAMPMPRFPGAGAQVAPGSADLARFRNLDLDSAPAAPAASPSSASAPIPLQID